jgi:hypothetical protein
MRSKNEHGSHVAVFRGIGTPKKNERLPFGTASQRFIKSSGKAFDVYIGTNCAPL